MRKLIRLPAIVLAALGLCTSAQAAKKSVDFSDFAGNYKGTVLIGVGGGSSVLGSANIVVKVPKNGRSASLTFSGIVTSGSTTLVLSDLLTFSASKAFFQQDISYNLLTQGVVATGSYTGKKKLSFAGRFNAGGDTPGTSSGTLAVHRDGKKKRKLVFSSALLVDGSPTPAYTFTFNATAKVKPSQE